MTPIGAPGPFNTLLGLRLLDHEDGVARMAAEPTPEHTNGAGILHGGYLASLLDSVTGWAVHHELPKGSAAVHVQLSVQYLRAGSPGSPIEVTARCTSSGRRICHSEGELRQDGRVIARATGTHAVVNVG